MEDSMYATTSTITHFGYTSHKIMIEIDTSNGLPGIIIVGMAQKMVDEARERIRSAMKNSNLELPVKRITINLAPADLPKRTTGLDLSVAIAILLASGQIKQLDRSSLFYGELGLDGTIRSTPDLLAVAIDARKHGFSTLYVGPDCPPVISELSGVTIIAAANLKDLYLHLIGEKTLNPLSARPSIANTNDENNHIDISDIRGQALAKRALQIAAAGGHNILMTGPPGSGKSMLAQAITGILPPPNTNEIADIIKIHSLAGFDTRSLLYRRPFRSPHHTASQVSLVGGGTYPKPGEISLAHHGVLFLDEIAEFPRSTIESLRQPLENRTVTVSRAAQHETFPASFMLVAAQNPCPCGYFGDPSRDCLCSSSQLLRYSQRISGPVMDRIDLHVEVDRVTPKTLSGNAASSVCSIDIAKTILNARSIQRMRYGQTATNAGLKLPKQEKLLGLPADVAEKMKTMAERLNLTARSYHKLLKVSRTIADLDDSKYIQMEHGTEAMQFFVRR